MVEQGQIVSADEVVARCAIHPRYLNPKGGPFDPKYLLDLRRAKDSFDFKTSVASREFLLATDEVHRYGCESAAISNRERVEAGKDVTPLRGAAHYIGFYNAGVSELQIQSNAVYRVFVEYWPEKGQQAHCHIVVAENPDLDEEQNKLKSFHRTNVITGIWEVMDGPYRHICACDEGVCDALEALELPDPQN
ncbi:hypothetical protein [Rhizobium wenxiniae]|uniref:hypothetical protein n=1 Tax=Rhizobium wenxiniae TaxID=1737357 RepID=UPI003C2424C2